MAHLINLKIIAAAAMLGAALLGISVAAQTGEINLQASGVEITLSAKNEKGVALSINHEKCPPNCPLISIDWKKHVEKASATGLQLIR